MTTRGATRELRESNIPWFDYKMWPYDTRSIVGSVMLAVCFAVTMQITERMDTVLTGGIFNGLGLVFQNVWFWPATMYFGVVGGLIAANFSPIIAMLTATGPLAPAWFAVNTAHVVPMAFLNEHALRERSATKSGISRWYFMTRMVPVAQVFTLMPLAVLWLFILRLPLVLVLIMLAVGWLLCFPGGFAAFYLCRSIGKSGVV